MKYFLSILFYVSIILFSISCTQEEKKIVSTVDANTFLSPDSTYYPGAYWWWLRCKTSKEAITKDLEEIKKKKIQDILLFDVGPGSGQKINLEYLDLASDEWNELAKHAILECKRLGLKLSISSGCTAPWIEPEESQQKLVFSEIECQGSTFVKVRLSYSADTQIDENGLPVYYQDIAVLAIPDKDVVTKEEIMDISGYLDKKGELSWDAPAGKWKIFRFGFTPTFKKMNEFKYLNRLRTDIYDDYYNRNSGNLLNSLTAEERSVMKFVSSDSWEAGVTGWCKEFEIDFKNRRGYDLIPFLLVFSGVTVDSKDVSERFMSDYRQTISDLIVNQYSYQQEVAHRNNMQTMCEGSGPHQNLADVLLIQKYSDVPMGEFWARAKTHRTTLKSRFLNKEAVSAGHIYGKTIISAEAFTSVGPQWEEDPYSLKPTADRAFCEGINKLYFHTYSHSPSLTAKPGYVYYAGSHFNRNITWWDYSYDWTTYLTRCQYLLQQGIPCADVCFYYGDGIKERKVYKQEALVLGDDYQYDYTNSDVILNRMTVHDNKICLPDGLSYEVLVLPEQKTISLEVLEKIRELVRSGATVVGVKPQNSLGLYKYEVTDQKVKQIADELWGKENSAIIDRRYGKGRVVQGKSVRNVLADKQVLPDLVYKSYRDSSCIDFTHRKDGDTEIYYLANLVEKPDYLNVTFRVTGKIPQLWDPLSGKIIEQKVYVDDGERITIPMYLTPFGSAFVLFKEQKQEAHIVSVSKLGENLFPQIPEQIVNETGSLPLLNDFVVFQGEGTYEVTYNTGQKKTITIDDIHSQEILPPWNVSFSEEWGGPSNKTFDSLKSWTESDIPGIKYYSGTAIYMNKIIIDEKMMNNTHIILDLGELFNVVEVIINGKNLGTCWMKPFRKDVSDNIHPGINTIELKVTNLWPNRLIGDQYLPVEKRFTETNITKFSKDDVLFPSGLLGPVRLLFIPNVPDL